MNKETMNDEALDLAALAYSEINGIVCTPSLRVAIQTYNATTSRLAGHNNGGKIQNLIHFTKLLKEEYLMACAIYGFLSNAPLLGKVEQALDQLKEV